MFLLPEGPRRLPERATRTAQYVGIVYQCSAAPHSPLPFLLLFDLRISYHSRSQMPLLTNYARDAISINGRTLELFQSVTFLFIKNSGWTKTRQTTLQKTEKKKNSSGNFSNVSGIVLYISTILQHLPGFISA